MKIIAEFFSGSDILKSPSQKDTLIGTATRSRSKLPEIVNIKNDNSSQTILIRTYCFRVPQSIPYQV